LKFSRTGVLGVECCRAMTDFTCNVLMVSGEFRLLDIIVTIATDHMSGILDFLGDDGVNCRGTVMPIFAEIRRQQHISNCNEQHD
jgi:hypothetical protein